MRVWIAVMVIAGLMGNASAGFETSYRVLSDDRFEARRVVAVELVERARLGELARIADGVRAGDRKVYERTIVNFYLPSMSLGDGSWATVSYTPEPHTTINGLSREEELAFIEKVRGDTRDRVGSWLASSTAIAGEVTIFRQKGKKFVEWSLRNGLTSTDELTETRTWRGRRFDIKSGSKTYFLVNSRQDLEIRDTKGLVAFGERILKSKSARRVLALQRAKTSRLRPVPVARAQRSRLGVGAPTPPVEVSVTYGRVPGGAGGAGAGGSPAASQAEALAEDVPVVLPKPKRRRVVVKPRETRKRRPSRQSAADVFRSNMMR